MALETRLQDALDVAAAAIARLGVSYECVGEYLLIYHATGVLQAFDEFLLAHGRIDVVGQRAIRQSINDRRMDSGPDTVLDPPRAGLSIEARPSVVYALTRSEKVPDAGERRETPWKLRAPATAEKYQTRRLLGRGGMGEVYEVRDMDLQRDVALKRAMIDRDQPELLARFIEEAQVSAQLEHPNIVPVYDIGILRDGAPFFTMRRVDGLTLSSVIAGLTRGDAELCQTYNRMRMAIVLLQMVHAVAYAHARGVVHCDLKPANVLLGRHGEVLVTDWGLARRIGQRMETSSLAPVAVTVDSSADTILTAGTPPYMAPEQVRGEPVDPRTDIYALGVILYQILTLEQPFEANTPQELLVEQERGFIAPRERAPDLGIPEEVDRICLQAMAFDPRDRFPTADELAKAIEAFVTGTRRRELALQRFREAEDCRLELERAWERRAELQVELARLAAQIKPYDGETKKAPMWRAEEELSATALGIDEAIARALDRYGQALSIDPAFVPAQDRLADLHLKLFLEAESRGDKRTELIHRRSLERHHRGRHATILDGRGLLTLCPADGRVRVGGWRLLERGKRIVRAEALDTDPTGFVNLGLAMGSYVFELTGAGLSPAILPVCVGRGRKVELRPRLFSGEAIGAEFVHIPAGPFVYGGDPEALNAGPREELALGDFFLARFPVTCGEYLTFLNSLVARDPHAAKRHVPRTKPDGGELWPADASGLYQLPTFDADGNPVFPTAPVMGVSFFDAQAYCNWQSERDGVVYRLPTEQEWEKAARGADGRVFPWGNGFDPTFCKMALSRPGRPQPEPVGSFPTDTSIYGVRDCAGAIREWCDSFFDAGKETRVLRGGAWYFNPAYCRLAFRHGYLPNIVFTNFGFRLCRDPVG